VENILQVKNCFIETKTPKLRGIIFEIQKYDPNRDWVSFIGSDNEEYWFTSKDVYENFVSLGLLDISKNLTCRHSMKDYIGLTKRYRYCTKCDYKEI